MIMGSSPSGCIFKSMKRNKWKKSSPTDIIPCFELVFEPSLSRGFTLTLGSYPVDFE